MKLNDFIYQCEHDENIKSYLDFKTKYEDFYKKWNYEEQAHTQPVTRAVMRIGTLSGIRNELRKVPTSFANSEEVFDSLQQQILMCWGVMKTIAADTLFGV